MSGPVRKPSAPVEATQELQALDVVELVEALKPKLASTARKPARSNSSIAPVGLDLASSGAAEPADDDADASLAVRLPPRRRRLGGIVIGTVAGCALILLAAVIARVGHASSTPSTATTPATADTTTAAPTPPATTTAPDPGTPSNAAPAPAATTAATTATAAPAVTAASTGTVRLDRPAVPGHVWLDGKKLTSRSAIVSCGTHQIKVGLRRTHSIDVPCGGEIGVAK